MQEGGGVREKNNRLTSHTKINKQKPHKNIHPKTDRTHKYQNNQKGSESKCYQVPDASFEIEIRFQLKSVANTPY